MTSAEHLANGVLEPSLFLDVLLKLGLVLFLVYFSLRLLRQYSHQLPSLSVFKDLQTQSQTQPVQILQVKPLNRQVTLYLVRCNQRQLLISVNGQHSQLLGDWPEQTENLSLEAETPLNT